MRQNLEQLAEHVAKGERRALARAITLAESRRPDHQEQAEMLLEHLLPYTGRAVRVGISGTPGAGKSTFIEVFGQYVIDQRKKIAVLAVDPSSRRSGGSILGDKTRMQQLVQTHDAFIRPSPSGTTLGGVARRTREAALLCEAAGFDVVLIETTGVGQGEVAVAEMVDCFVLLLAPGGGDELQGIKRGIVELADLVVINKADGDLLGPARIAKSDYQAALHLLRQESSAWSPEVLTCSALTNVGIADVWEAINRHRAALEQAGELEAKRADQARSWLYNEVEAGLIEMLQRDPDTSTSLIRMERLVSEGEVLPVRGAHRVLERFRARAAGTEDAEGAA